MWGLASPLADFPTAPHSYPCSTWLFAFLFPTWNHGFVIDDILYAACIYLFFFVFFFLMEGKMEITTSIKRCNALTLPSPPRVLSNHEAGVKVSKHKHANAEKGMQKRQRKKKEG